jgi:amidase
MLHIILAAVAVAALARWPSQTRSALVVGAAASASVLLGAPVAPALTLVAPLLAFLGAALTLAGLAERSGLGERAAAALAAAGATVAQTSIPLWSSAFAIWLGMLVATWAPMLRTYSTGFGHLGLVEVERAHAASLVRREEGHLLPATVKLVLLVNSYLDERYHGVPLARAHNQRLALRKAFDDALGHFEVLLAPTVPRVAVELPLGRLTPVEAMSRIVSETILAGPVNVTGHPALAVPSGRDAQGLPTSAQVIGPRFGDRRVLAAGAAIEEKLG